MSLHAISWSATCTCTWAHGLPEVTSFGILSDRLNADTFSLSCSSAGNNSNNQHLIRSQSRSYLGNWGWLADGKIYFIHLFPFIKLTVACKWRKQRVTYEQPLDAESERTRLHWRRLKGEFVLTYPGLHIEKWIFPFSVCWRFQMVYSFHHRINLVKMGWRNIFSPDQKKTFVDTWLAPNHLHVTS